MYLLLLAIPFYFLYPIFRMLGRNLYPPHDLLGCFILSVIGSVLLLSSLVVGLGFLMKACIVFVYMILCFWIAFRYKNIFMPEFWWSREPMGSVEWLAAVFCLSGVIIVYSVVGFLVL